MARAHEEDYDTKYAIMAKLQDEKYNKIIADFEALTLEEKVDRLIKVYAIDMAYKL